MFAHSPLDRERREVRLVRFTRAALEDANATLALELRHASLDGGIPYAAMSYVWGDASDAIQINIDNKPLPIGRNLHGGLERLQNERVDSWLWIDAICIQQSDTDEKSWQVDQMRDIYRLAELVYIWLGPGTPESDVAIDFLARFGPGALACGALNLNAATHDDPHKEGIFAYLDARLNSPPKPADETAKPEPASNLDALAAPPQPTGPNSDHDPECESDHTPSSNHNPSPKPNPDLPPFIHALLTHIGLLSPYHPLQPGLLTLLENPYWTRIWIIQEAALARHALLLYGTAPSPSPSHSPSHSHSHSHPPSHPHPHLPKIPLDELHATLTTIWYILSSGILPRYRPRFEDWGAMLWEWSAVLRVRALMARERVRRAEGSGVVLAEVVVEFLGAPGGDGGRAHFAAGDGRDLVFGLLGLVGGDGDGGDGRMGLRADYGMGVAEVWARFTRGLLRAGGGGVTPFSLMCVAPRREGEGVEGLPSWVPDWGDVGRRGLGVDTADVLGCAQACQGMEPGAALEGGDVGGGGDNPLVLRVVGCRVDTIAEVMPAAEWAHANLWDVLEAEIKDVDAWIQSIIAFSGLPSDYEGSSDEEEEEEEKEEVGQWTGKQGDDDEKGKYEDEDGESDGDDDEEQSYGGSEEDGIWRTVLRNRRDGIYQDIHRFGRPLNKNERHLIRRIFRREPINPHTLTRSQAEFVRNGPLLRMCEHASSMGFPEQVAYLAREWPRHVGNANRHTTLFKTAGGLLGAGHESVRSGDVVTILHGENRPMILRPRGTTTAEGFTLQGYAYVDGIMYGEFFCAPPQPGQRFKPLVGTGINNVGSYWATRDQRGYRTSTQDGEHAEPGKRVLWPECEAFELY